MHRRASTFIPRLWSAGVILAVVPAVHAGIPIGACCVDSVCSDNGGLGIAQDTCELVLGGVFQGDGSTCQTVTCPPPVPTLSQWGIVVMSLLLLAAGTILHAKRIRPRPLTICIVAALLFTAPFPPAALAGHRGRLLVTAAAPADAPGEVVRATTVCYVDRCRRATDPATSGTDPGARSHAGPQAAVGAPCPTAGGRTETNAMKGARREV